MGQNNSCLVSHLDLLPVTALTTACRPAASSSKEASNSTVSPLKRTASARVVRLTSSGPGKTFFIVFSTQLVLLIIPLYLLDLLFVLDNVYKT